MMQQNAKKFAEDWKDRGYEKGESQKFWLTFLRDVCGAENPEDLIEFEDQVHLDNTSFIDGYMPETKVLIEQKSSNKSLTAPIRQSDGSLLTPFQQAKRYSSELPYSLRPRWVVTCNFQMFHIYDMEHPNAEPEIIRLADLEKEYYRFRFLVDTGEIELRKKEMELSIEAGELVGKIYSAILKQYKDPTSPETLQSLNKLCVRLVFLLYAEDSGVFDEHLQFHDYLKKHWLEDRDALIKLFRVLDQKPEERDPYLAPDLAAFPYVNGELFKDEDIEIPRLGDDVIDLILRDASEGFDWSRIIPTIFGAVFESTLNPETRRSGGMHYTSLENIHKVIDPLFLDDLQAELAEIEAIQVKGTRTKKLRTFQKKLASLTFLDPACGSGNFLTETFLSLRRIENRVISDLYKGQQMLGEAINPVQVSIGQFYGIELNDFAVAVAKTALWIAEAQMLKETMSIVQMPFDFLPLKSYTNIIEGNALQMDWNGVVAKSELNYIMGNPPFAGARMMGAEQKADVKDVFDGWKKAGNLDYVSCWYKKASALMVGTTIRAALVSTNSVTQGETVANLWKPLFEMGIHIDFAHRTFRWDSEAKIKAHVHCVIVGFSTAPNPAPRIIYASERPQIAQNINGYLLDAPNVFVESRKEPLCDVPEMVFGNTPIDGGNLVLEADELDEFLKNEPGAKMYVHRLVGSKEFINNLSRYCLWLVDANPADLRKMPLLKERIQAVQEMRRSSKRAATRKLADTPSLFGEIRQPTAKNYLAVPKVSSEQRRYVPMGFIDGDTIASDLVFILPNASLYQFGILTSNVHMAWMRAVCGRLEMRYRYSSTVVYNNFPWPTPTEAQKAKIEKTAQAILDARALYPDASLADLYDDRTMPPELRMAHQKNDRAVMEAYGFGKEDNSESACVARLMKMYEELTKQEKNVKKAKG